MEGCLMPETDVPNDQSALPGMDVGTEQPWVLTIECDGLTYTVVIDAMTKADAAETFNAEFEEYEVGVEDGDFEWDHETVWARSQADAEEIALERDREYMRTYQAPCLGNRATVVSTEPFDAVDGSKVRRAKSEADLVA